MTEPPADDAAGADPLDEAVPPYAGFGVRAVAAIVDGLLAIGAVLPAMLALLLGPSHDATCAVGGSTQSCTQPDSGTIMFATVLFVAGVAAYLYWYCRRVGRRQSVGQRAVALRVADIRTGRPIGGWRAFERQLAKLVSLIPLGLGFLWMLWDPRRQTWHDKIAGTVVVRHRPGEPVAP